EEMRTIVLYEAPHHLKATLNDLYKYLGDRKISLCRELTKKHEDVMRTTIVDAIDFYSENEPRGEYVLVIEGKSREEKIMERRAAFEEMSIEEHVQYYIAQGLDKKEAMKKAAKDRGISKRDVYNALV
ncbi:MAG: 16S rRNA (cytidine(1402)-2'-O)-methyltransferase, partial [Lachnospiraceae bacterium]|nr:16S rRNA (cytidine(1402)-2'-O)-methyltransferase [Lachnospiraceae bacterium]